MAILAWVVKLVYTRVLEARAVRRGGSSPLPGTKVIIKNPEYLWIFCFYR